MAPEAGPAATRIDATPTARAAIAAMRAARGGALMFVQSGGCCAGSVPMCFEDGTLLVGQGDLLLGSIEGCPFYIDVRLYDALRRPRFTLDVDAGDPGGFSLAAGPGLRFVTRSAAAAGTDEAVPGSTTANATSCTPSTDDRNPS